jgi:hypothetical protein
MGPQSLLLVLRGEKAHGLIKKETKDARRSQLPPALSEPHGLGAQAGVRRSGPSIAVCGKRSAFPYGDAVRPVGLLYGLLRGRDAKSSSYGVGVPS